MDGIQFEKELIECKEELERICMSSQAVTEKICKLLEEYDGESGEVKWSCRTMNSDIDDVLSDVRRRLERFQAGDRKELPSVLVLALDCCERLSDTAVLFSEGRQDERRDLKGQMTSNLGYLAHHIEAMKEDEYITEGSDIFDELKGICEKIYSNTVEMDELKDFVCGPLKKVHAYLKELRENNFWEEA